MNKHLQAWRYHDIDTADKTVMKAIELGEVYGRQEGFRAGKRARLDEAAYKQGFADGFESARRLINLKEEKNE